MTNLKNYGRIFFGLAILGIGALHFFYPGIRPLIIPGLKDLPPALHFLGYLTGALLVLCGILITVGRKYSTLSLIMGAVCLVLFFAGHLPTFLTAGPLNGNFWINMNKIIALSGGFLVLASPDPPASDNRIILWLKRLAPAGMYLYAIMLYNFSVGHILSMDGVSRLVPKYIPFPRFWTFVGGIALMGSAISIFTGIMTKKILLVFATVLFIWLWMLHFYYLVRFPAWNEGENFIGVFTCLAFCGTALSISQEASARKPEK